MHQLTHFLAWLGMTLWASIVATAGQTDQTKGGMTIPALDAKFRILWTQCNSTMTTDATAIQTACCGAKFTTTPTIQTIFVFFIIIRGRMTTLTFQ